jgi:hypothetical protein
MNDSTFKINPGEARQIASIVEERAVKFRMSAEGNDGEHAVAENALALMEADRLEQIADALRSRPQSIRIGA